MDGKMLNTVRIFDLNSNHLLAVGAQGYESTSAAVLKSHPALPGREIQPRRKLPAPLRTGYGGGCMLYFEDHKTPSLKSWLPEQSEVKAIEYYKGTGKKTRD
jgi:hypothetical protein